MNQEAELEEIRGWFAGRIPDDWFDGPPEVEADRDEILVIGTLPEVDLGPDASGAAREAARTARIERFREDTRGQRMAIADEAQRRFGRRVSWGARSGDLERHCANVTERSSTRWWRQGLRGVAAMRSLGVCVWSGNIKRSGSRTCGTRCLRSKG
jgi:hypothetical protein